MKIEIKESNFNSIIGRREVTFIIDKNSTPSRSETRRELAVLLEKNLDNIWIRQLKSKTGINITMGLAHVYDNPEIALQYEPKYIINRNKQTFEQLENTNSDLKKEDNEE